MSKVPQIETFDRALVVGLGNPGSRYEGTRHNVGFDVLDKLADRAGISLRSKKHDGLYGDGFLGTRRIALLKPQTFMNLSGRSVAPAMRYFSVPEGGIVVIHDDIDLAFGVIRIKWAGGHGGHNGLRSIDSLLGGPSYFRVRVGVGRPRHGSPRDHVLSRFSSRERDELYKVLDGGVDAVEGLLREGLKPTQNCIHGTRFVEPEPIVESTGGEAKRATAGGAD